MAESFLVTVSRSVKCDVIVSKHLKRKTGEEDIFRLRKLDFVQLLILVSKKPCNTSIIKLVCQSVSGNFVRSAPIASFLLYFTLLCKWEKLIAKRPGWNQSENVDELAASISKQEIQVQNETGLIWMKWRNKDKQIWILNQ